MCVTTATITWAIVIYALIFLIGMICGALIVFGIVNNYIMKTFSRRVSRMAKCREANKREASTDIFKELEEDVECSKSSCP